MIGWATRNWGCRVGGCVIGGMDAVVLENRVLRVTVLAGKGAEIIELAYKPKDVDVLWRGPNGIVNPYHGVPSVTVPAGSFADSYNGGWQELAPTLGAPADYYGAPMGEHGEVALLPWVPRVERDDARAVTVSFGVRCRRSPFELRRTMTLEGPDSPTLVIREELENQGGEPLELMWGHHPVLGPPLVEPGCSIDVPGGTVQPMELSDGRFVPRGPATPWPRYVHANGALVDLRVVGDASAAQVDEFYVGGLDTGRVDVRNHRIGIGFTMRWDLNVFRYLWWWRNLGPSAGYPWYSRAYMLGLEPFSSVPPAFEAAVQAGTTLSLDPGQTMTSWLDASIYALEGRDGSEESPKERILRARATG
jgi:galactose mutarotase-like enzyme